MPRITHSKEPLPKLFHTHPAGKGIVSEALLKISNHSRLRAKLLVFDTNRSMGHFYTHALDKPGAVCPKTRGICSSLTYELVKFHPDGRETSRLVVDPKYFCLIGLLAGHLTTEIITHESVHAAFAYKARMRGRVWSQEHELEEEEICYPAGVIARLVTQHLKTENLI